MPLNNHLDSNIDRFTPSSSFLELAEYDKKAYAMTLTFKNGNQYKYLWVFPTVWETFKQSPDHSSFYSKAIKGKMLNIALKKSNVEHQHSTPLHKQKLKRGLINGKLNHPRKPDNVGKQPGRIPGSLNRP